MVEKSRSRSKASKLRLIKIPTTIYLEPWQSEALKALSKRTKVPQQEYLRKGLQRILDENRRLINGANPD